MRAARTPYAIRLPNMGKLLYPLPVRPWPWARDRWGAAMERLLGAAPDPATRGQLYVHLPFCQSICTFCAIQKYQLAPKSPVAAYVAALLRELDALADLSYVRQLRFTNVYFGGGTPSVLADRWLAEILELIQRRFRLETAQITFEGNVQSLTAEKLRFARSLGFNRLSAGVQTFDPELRRRLDLVPTGDDIRRCLDDAHAAGFEDFNLDLMFNLPGQTTAIWERDLRQAVELAPTGLDIYETVVAQKTPLYGQVRRRELPLLRDPALAACHYLLAEELLGAAGYVQQNLYVWNRRGFENRLMGSMDAIRDRALDIVGAGNSAFSSISEIALLNEPHLADYIASAGRGSGTTISYYEPNRRQRMERFLIMSLQTFLLDRARFAARFGEEMEGRFGPALASFRRKGLLEPSPEGYRLTALGRAWASTMAIELYDPAYLQDVMRGRLGKRLAAGLTREEEYEQILFTFFHPEAVLRGPLDPRLLLAYLRLLRRSDPGWWRELLTSLWHGLRHYRRLPVRSYLALAWRMLRGRTFSVDPAGAAAATAPSLAGRSTR